MNALSGAIQVESRKGHGTTFTIRLPLTLAIIDGFAVKVDTETYLIPLSSVQECLELPAEKHYSDEGGVINLRGEALPYVRLRDLFGCGGRTPAQKRIIVFEYQGGRAGLAADELPLERLTAERSKQYLRQGEFPPGRMGPKIEAALEFLEAGGFRAMITCAENVAGALHREKGTEILPPSLKVHEDSLTRTNPNNFH